MHLMSDREQVRVYVSTKAKDEIERTAKMIGASQIELLSRLCEWFAAQDKGEKLKVLGILNTDEHVSRTAQNAKKSG